MNDSQGLVDRPLCGSYDAGMLQIKAILKYPGFSCVLLTTLAGCANISNNTTHTVENSAPTTLLTPQPDILLLGEQHDAPEHQQWQRKTIAQWAASGKLAAVVMEMADAGRSTQAMDKSVDESTVQLALGWNDKGWPWQAYGPVVMVAVRAGVPVLGGNLPRAHMREVMQQTQWDNHLPTAAWLRQLDAIREGHCGLLPESQLAPMARIQLAKDASMARTAQQQVQTGKTVVLIAGRGHVLRSIGIPSWLPAGTRSVVAIGQAGDAVQTTEADRDEVYYSPAVPARDHCAELTRQWKE